MPPVKSNTHWVHTGLTAAELAWPLSWPATMQGHEAVQLMERRRREAPQAWLHTPGVSLCMTEPHASWWSGEQRIKWPFALTTTGAGTVPLCSVGFTQPLGMALRVQGVYWAGGTKLPRAWSWRYCCESRETPLTSLSQPRICPLSWHWTLMSTVWCFIFSQTMGR